MWPGSLPTNWLKFATKKIGFVFQSFNLLARTSALENVQLPLMYSGANRQTRMAAAERVLTEVGLQDRMDHHPSQLSGGQQQRVAVARALVNDPSLILADEPTGNLDSSHGEELMNILSDLNKNGSTIIIVTHSQRDADYCQRIIRLFDGKIIHENVVQNQ